MKKVYICSPLSGNINANLMEAVKYCRCATLTSTDEEKVLPIAPHLYFTRFLNDKEPDERQIGIRLGLELMDICEELWVFGYTVTEGMAAEISAAANRNIPIRWFCYCCEEASEDNGEVIEFIRERGIVNGITGTIGNEE